MGGGMWLARGMPLPLLAALCCCCWVAGPVLGLLCKACEGDMCNYQSMSISCDFPLPVRQCMRLFSPQTGRTYRAGCLYPSDDCGQVQRQNDQIRCLTCPFDNCNSVPSPYEPGQPAYGPYYPPPGGGPGSYNPTGANGRQWAWNGGGGARTGGTMLASALLLLLAALVLG